MEYNLNEESTNSGEEASKGDDENNVDLGVGRSYECVYCKRGFNTAQALGGHMNIHRKDKAKKKPDTSNNSKRQEEIYAGPRLYQQLPSYNYQSDNYAPRHDHEPILMSYATYFPGSDSSTRSPLDGNDCNHQQPLNLLIPDDWHVGFSTKKDMEMNGSGVIFNQKEELDLELRLGYI